MVNVEAGGRGKTARAALRGATHGSRHMASDTTVLTSEKEGRRLWYRYSGKTIIDFDETSQD